MRAKRLNSIILLLLLFIASFPLFQSFDFKSASAVGANWLAGWGYRKQHNVSRIAGGGVIGLLPSKKASAAAAPA